MSTCNATLSNRGFTAWVECDGKKLECYDTQNVSENVTTCWVASEAGKAFSVHWREELDTGISTSGKCFLDGKYVTSHRLYGEAGCLAKAKTLRVSVTEKRMFEFSTITYEGGNIDQQANNDAMGSIRVEIHRVRLGKMVSRKFHAHTAAVLPSSQPDKKTAAIHHTSFGEAVWRPLKTKKASSTPYTPEDKRPYVSFLFQYRPRDRLQFLNFIKDDGDPMETGPQPKSAPRKKSTSSHNEEYESELKNVQLLEAELAKARSRLQSKKAKGEPVEDDLPAKQKVKTKGVKFARRDEVIDLTLD